MERSAIEPTNAHDTDAAAPLRSALPATSYDPAFPVEQLRESPHNPRKTFGDLTEIAESMRDNGVLSPLLTRPIDGGLREIVFGHRRFRAAKLAGLTTVPVNCRTISDRDSREMQIVENSQREDLHPLEEADGYHQLHVEDGYTVEALAAKIGKSPSHVYGRLKLAQLGPEAREAFVAGKFQIAVALTLAQLSDLKLQAAAAAEVSVPQWPGAGPWTTAAARQHILRKYMLRLESAPFDVADAQLVPAAGACTGCPKNTGRQVALFPTEPTEALCTDAPCFELKRAAGWVKREAEAAKRDEHVLSEAEVKKLTGGNPNFLNLWNSPYVALDGAAQDDPKRRKYSELLKGQKFPKSLARTTDGVVHELVEKKLLPKLLKAAGHDFDKLEKEMAAERAAAAPKGKGGKPAVDPMKAYREQQKKLKAEAELKSKITLAKIRAARDALLARAAQVGDDRPFWQWLTRMVIMLAGYGAAAVVELRDLKPAKGKSSDVTGLMLAEAGQLAPSGSKVMLTEILTAHAVDMRDDDALEEVQKFLKIDFDAIDKRLRTEAATAAKAPPPAKGKAPAKVAPKAPAKGTSKPAAPTGAKGTSKTAKASKPVASKPLAKKAAKRG